MATHNAFIVSGGNLYRLAVLHMAEGIFLFASEEMDLEEAEYRVSITCGLMLDRGAVLYGAVKTGNLYKLEGTALYLVGTLKDVLHCRPFIGPEFFMPLRAPWVWQVLNRPFPHRGPISVRPVTLNYFQKWHYIFKGASLKAGDFVMLQSGTFEMVGFRL
jgi:hypothetical protein